VIIQVCGTNGSGKSTIIDKVMAAAADREDLLDDDTGKIRGYEMAVHGQPLVVVGRYHAITARGCDAIKDRDYNLETVRLSYKGGYHVLFEGIRMMSHTRGIDFFRELGYPNVTLLLLDTPVETCISAILARSGKTRDQLAISNIFGTNVRARNYVTKLQALGARKIVVNRDNAAEVIVECLSKISPTP
jgi:thymidylate kinase